AWRTNAVRAQRRVLCDLADLELQRATVVDDAPAVQVEPGEHTACELGGITMVPRVRGRTHAVVEHALRGRGVEIERSFAQEPFLVRQMLLGKALPQRFDPGVVFVDDVDAGHENRTDRR